MPINHTENLKYLFYKICVNLAVTLCQTMGLHVLCSLADTQEFCLEAIATVYVIFRTYS